MPKVILPKRVTETMPKIGDATFALARTHEEPDRKPVRKDFWFSGEVEINKLTIPYEIHLFSCDGSIKGSKGRYNCSIDLNKPNVEGIGSCPYCSGNRGVSSPETRGLTAQALAPVLFPRVEHAGYSIFPDNHKPGGWYLFDMHCNQKNRDDVADVGFYRTPRYSVSWIHEIDCPVHGKFLWKEIEFGA